MQLSRKFRNMVSARWARVKLLTLTIFARLLGVHLGLWRDIQNFGFYVVTLERPAGTQQLAVHLFPDVCEDLYFPVSTQPEVMRVEPFDMPPGPRSLGRMHFYRPLVEGLRLIYGAARRLHSQSCPITA